MATAAPARRIITPATLVDAVKRQRIEIGPTDRAFFCGTTGSGKTTLALRGFLMEPTYTICDPKADIAIPDVPVVSTYDPKLPRQIIMEPDGKTEMAAWEAQLQAIYEARIPQILYLDEITAMSASTHMPFYLGKVIRLGRGRGLGVWSASQRPVDVPNALITEAIHYFIGFLNYPPDIEKIASMTTPAVRAQIPQDFYHFLYYNKISKRLIHIQP